MSRYRHIRLTVIVAVHHHDMLSHHSVPTFLSSLRYRIVHKRHVYITRSPAIIRLCLQHQLRHLIRTRSTRIRHHHRLVPKTSPHQAVLAVMEATAVAPDPKRKAKTMLHVTSALFVPNHTPHILACQSTNSFTALLTRTLP